MRPGSRKLRTPSCWRRNERGSGHPLRSKVPRIDKLRTLLRGCRKGRRPLPQFVDKGRLRGPLLPGHVSPAPEARPGKRAGKPCCARLPNPPRMSPGSDCLWRAAALQASPMVFRRMAWEGTAPLPASPQKYFLFVDTQGRRECHPAGLCAPQGCQDRKIGLVQALRPCASTTSARR